MVKMIINQTIEKQRIIMKSFKLALIMTAFALTASVQAKDIDTEVIVIEFFEKSPTLSDLIKELSQYPDLKEWLKMAESIKKTPSSAFKLKHLHPKFADAIQKRFNPANPAQLIAMMKFIKN